MFSLKSLHNPKLSWPSQHLICPREDRRYVIFGLLSIPCMQREQRLKKWEHERQSMSLFSFLQSVHNVYLHTFAHATPHPSCKCSSPPPPRGSPWSLQPEFFSSFISWLQRLATLCIFIIFSTHRHNKVSTFCKIQCSGLAAWVVLQAPEH